MSLTTVHSGTAITFATQISPTPLNDINHEQERESAQNPPVPDSDSLTDRILWIVPWGESLFLPIQEVDNISHIVRNTARCLTFLAITILSVATIVLTIFLVIFVQKYYSVYPEPQVLGLNGAIKYTWNGGNITHAPITFAMTWNDKDKAINIKYKAPLYLNPAPPNHTAGVVPGLFNYEVVEFFFLNSKNQYVEIELGPMNQYLALLLYTNRQAFNNGDYLQLAVWNILGNNTWNGEVDIPLAYFPPNVTLFNAYNIHTEGGPNGTKIYEAYSPNTNGTRPDFHRLEFFAPFDHSLVIPKEYFSETHTYNDSRYPDLWKGYY